VPNDQPGGYALSGGVTVRSRMVWNSAATSGAVTFISRRPQRLSHWRPTQKGSGIVIASEHIHPPVAHIVLDDSGGVTVEYIAELSRPHAASLSFSWRAQGVSGVDASGSVGVGVTLTQLGSSVRAIVQPVADEPASLRLRYKLKLENISRKRDGPFVLRPFNLPRPVTAQTTRLPQRIPWRHPPDLTLEVRGAGSDRVVLGPRRVNREGERGEHFGFYDCSPFGSLLIGRLGTIDDGGCVPVLTLSEGDAISEEIVRFVGAEAERLVGVLRSDYGEPAIEIGPVVIASWEREPSTSFGSGVLLNIGPMLRQTSSRERQFLIANTLAHELAHSWWTYSALWNDKETALVANEMVATVAELSAARAIGGPERLKSAVKWGLWATLGGALRTAGSALRNSQFGLGGAWAAALINGLMMRRAESVRRALQDLWESSHQQLLSREQVLGAFTARLGRQSAVAILDALDHPKPIVATTRLETPKRQEPWRLILHPKAKDVERLLTRLGSCPPLGARIALHGKRVILELTSFHDVNSAAFELQPTVVISRREARALRLTGDDLRSRLWRWAKSLTQEQAPNRGGLRLLASLVCVLLNADHPVGFLGMARANLPIGVRRLCLKAAAARSFYHSDEPVPSDSRG
jgi:hypothetical protein